MLALKKVYIWIVAITVAMTHPVAGSEILNGTVNTLMSTTADPSQTNIVFVSVIGSRTGSYSCSTHGTWEFALDVSTQQGVLMYSMLLTALKDNRSVHVFGPGTCALFGGIETLNRAELL